MSSQYSTIQQHEPLRVPSDWNQGERKLVAQLEEILDDIYRRFNRLSLDDLSPALREMIQTSADGLTSVKTTLKQTSTNLEAVAERVETLEGESEEHTTAIGSLEVGVGEVQAFAGEYDEYLQQMRGTSATLDSDGLYLRSNVGSQEATYTTKIASNGLSILDAQGNTKASFQSDGAYIKSIRAEEELSIGTTSRGWFDFVMLSSGMAIKWRGLNG